MAYGNVCCLFGYLVLLLLIITTITGVLSSKKDSKQSYYNFKFTVRRTSFSKTLELKLHHKAIGPCIYMQMHRVSASDEVSLNVVRAHALNSNTGEF